MELEELQVAQGHARAEGHRGAVARADARVRAGPHARAEPPVARTTAGASRSSGSPRCWSCTTTPRTRASGPPGSSTTRSSTWCSSYRRTGPSGPECRSDVWNRVCRRWKPVLSAANQVRARLMPPNRRTATSPSSVRDHGSPTARAGRAPRRRARRRTGRRPPRTARRRPRGCRPRAARASRRRHDARRPTLGGDGVRAHRVDLRDERDHGVRPSSRAATSATASARSARRRRPDDDHVGVLDAQRGHGRPPVARGRAGRSSAAQSGESVPRHGEGPRAAERRNRRRSRSEALMGTAPHRARAPSVGKVRAEPLPNHRSTHASRPYRRPPDRRRRARARPHRVHRRRRRRGRPEDVRPRGDDDGGVRAGRGRRGGRRRRGGGDRGGRRAARLGQPRRDAGRADLDLHGRRRARRRLPGGRHAGLEGRPVRRPGPTSRSSRRATTSSSSTTSSRTRATRSTSARAS